MAQIRAGLPPKGQTSHGSGQPFTEPAVTPRTKNRCRAKNTISGTRVITKAPADNKCSRELNSPASDATTIVAGSASRLPPIIVNAIR